MGTIIDGVRWLFDGENWGGRGGLNVRIWQHLWYSGLATVVAAAIGLPIGLLIGHTGRGRFAAVNVAGVWRAIPTIGVVTLLFRWRPLSVWPLLAALVLLAVPSIVLNTAAGIEAVSRDVRDAARGMGLTGWQSLWQVEVPNALPLMLAGVRSAANQVIATAAVGGFIGLGTLGHYIYIASRTRDGEVTAGASIAIIALVLAVEGLFAFAQRALVSEGVRARMPRRVRARGSLPATLPGSRG